MKLEDFRDLVEGKDVFQPFVIRTKGGRAYPIRHRANVWLPEDYELTVCVAIRGKGITLLDVAAIESVQFEHDIAAFH
jgi:hypothetical protein